MICVFSSRYNCRGTSICRGFLVICVASSDVGSSRVLIFPLDELRSASVERLRTGEDSTREEGVRFGVRTFRATGASTRNKKLWMAWNRGWVPTELARESQ